MENDNGGWAEWLKTLERHEQELAQLAGDAKERMSGGTLQMILAEARVAHVATLRLRANVLEAAGR